MNIASSKKEKALGLINLQANQIDENIKNSASYIKIYAKDSNRQSLKYENQIQSLKDLKKSYEELNIWSPCVIIKLIKTDPTKEILELTQR